MSRNQTTNPRGFLNLAPHTPDKHAACALWVRSLPSEFVSHNDLELVEDHQEIFQSTPPPEVFPLPPEIIQSPSILKQDKNNKRPWRFLASEEQDGPIKSQQVLMVQSSSHTSQTNKRVRFDMINIDTISRSASDIIPIQQASGNLSERMFSSLDEWPPKKASSSDGLSLVSNTKRLTLCDRGTSSDDLSSVFQPKSSTNRTSRSVDTGTSPIRFQTGRGEALDVANRTPSAGRHAFRVEPPETSASGKQINFVFHI